MICANVWSIDAQSFKLDTLFNADYNFYNWENIFNPVVYNILESPDNHLYVSGDIYDYAPPYGVTLLRFDSCRNQDMSFQAIVGLRNPLHVLCLETIHSVGRNFNDTYYLQYDL